MSATFERELGQALRVAREAGALLQENFGKSQEVEYKGRIDLVTEMDHRSEELIIGRLRAALPGDGFWAEERGREAGTGQSDRVWIIDPLDGTVNYAHEYPVFSVSIALQVAGWGSHAQRPAAAGEQGGQAGAGSSCDRLRV